MIPEILIVGDPQHQASLARRIGGLGYDVGSCLPADVDDRLAGGPAPSAVVVCTADADPAVIMARLRSIPQGAAVPVTLYGRLGGEIRDLADVLDLGADHFLEDPVPDDQLVAALEALAGPPARPPAGEALARADAAQQDAATGGFESWPARTEVIDEPERALDGAAVRTVAEPGGGGPSGDPVIGQLHRTLDLLDERLRGRDVPSAEERDDVDLAALGLDGVPDVDADAGEVLDPAESHDRMELRDLRANTRRLQAPTVVPRDTPPIGPRGSTVLLDAGGAVKTPKSPQPRPDPPWRVGNEGALAIDRTEPPPPTVKDHPRRMAPLPVDDEGSLSVIEVPRLLWKLHRAAFSGRVSLVRGRIDKHIWFERGNIVFARSNLGHDRLIDGLLRRGLLTRGQYDAARRLAAKEPRRAGQLLVEAGFLKPGELHRVLREHLMRIVDSTFPWNEGTWSLEANVDCRETVLLDASTALVVAEGVRSRMETPQLWALLGGPRQHPRLRDEALVRAGGARSLAEELRMSPSEEAWLPKLDGKHSLQGLSDDPVVDELELLGLVYLLHVLELVDLVGEPEPEPEQAHDPAMLDRRRIEGRLRAARTSDYFELLGIGRDATRTDVRRAHAELSRTFSDDGLEVSTRRELAAELSEIRAALDEARAVLGDDALRTAYLAHLEEP